MAEVVVAERGTAGEQELAVTRTRHPTEWTHALERLVVSGSHENGWSDRLTRVVISQLHGAAAAHIAARCMNGAGHVTVEGAISVNTRPSHCSSPRRSGWSLRPGIVVKLNRNVVDLLMLVVEDVVSVHFVVR